VQWPCESLRTRVTVTAEYLKEFSWKDEDTELRICMGVATASS